MVIPPVDAPKDVSIWLDDVNSGWGERYGNVFRELGIQDAGDVALITPDVQGVLDSALTGNGTKLLQLSKIREAISRMQSCNQNERIGDEESENQNEALELARQRTCKYRGLLVGYCAECAPEMELVKAELCSRMPGECFTDR